ncbi:MAG TPA: hypothetical protein VJ976_02275 [Ornithinimicrobium sp.]|uniref:DUF2515 family protein n=1 Tax=Ornithinimicrobium sp. TaxID=1977084 RepID=UPI002B47A533|nr:hypothetical protein [Ornithinimicrobium sp.]HKJ11196.1 hypothetical protein [Ornithinimicrobium sp.]
MEVSSRYASLYRQLPSCFKWAAMAAIASHHIRLALFPLRLDTDRGGYLDVTRSLSRRGLLTGDAHTIRETNNAIYDDIYWVHLAYVADEHGMDRVRQLLNGDQYYATVLSAFESIDRGRRLLADETSTEESRNRGRELVWAGNIELLDHEQRSTVQPQFARLSRLFAHVISMGATTSFEVHGVRQELRYFSSFYLYFFTGGLSHALRPPTWPRITRLEHRWRWLEASVVPRFRRLEGAPHLIEASLTRVVDDARQYVDRPCIAPI